MVRFARCVTTAWRHSFSLSFCHTQIFLIVAWLFVRGLADTGHKTNTPLLHTNKLVTELSRDQRTHINLLADTLTLIYAVSMPLSRCPRAACTDSGCGHSTLSAILSLLNTDHPVKSPLINKNIALPCYG